MSTATASITSRDNPWFKQLRRLAQDNTAYRTQGRIWVEGDHLCRAAIERGWRPATAVFAESVWRDAAPRWRDAAASLVLVADRLFADLSGVETASGAARMGFVLALPEAKPLAAGVPTVVLDRLQDAGNVGSVLRSAGAFGFRQVVALKGSAALWSSKVLRAGMGAHFGLSLHEGATVEDLVRLGVPLVVTSSHQGGYLHQTALPHPCAWVMGHEGQGVAPDLLDRAALAVRIAQPGGEESLNVAAAAAICLHASASGRP